MKYTYIYYSFFIMLCNYSCRTSKIIDIAIDGYVKNQDIRDSIYQHTDIERKTTIISSKFNKDTIKTTRVISKKRVIFKRGKIYTYDVTYLGERGDTLSYNEIELVPLGRRDPMALNQDDIVFNNAYNKSDSIKFSINPLNKSYKFRWEKQPMEGVIENSEQVWMHPLRQNHYFLTEAAPFPSVYLPIHIGQKWTKDFKILDGGDWSNKKGQHYYKVVKKTKRLYGKNYLDCWQIDSKAKFEFGVSYLTFYFNEQNGFVEMNYKNFAGHKLNIILKKVEYKTDLSFIKWDNLKNFWLHDVLTD